MIIISIYKNVFNNCNRWVITSKTELNILTRTSRVVIRRPLRLETSSRGRRKLDQETATKNPAHRRKISPANSNLTISYEDCTCGYKIEQKIFLPLSLHLDSEPCGGDSLPGQLDQEVLLLNWPNLRLKNNDNHYLLKKSPPHQLAKPASIVMFKKC